MIPDGEGGQGDGGRAMGGAARWLATGLALVAWGGLALQYAIFAEMSIVT